MKIWSTVLVVTSGLALVPAQAIERKSVSYRTALRNFALAACMGEIAKDKVDRDDANLSAGAYGETGSLGVEDEHAIMGLVKQFAARKYGGTVPGDFNTMKCIDLFYSQDLTRLIAVQTRRKLNNE